MLLSPMNPVAPGPSMPHLDHACTSAALPLESGLFPPGPLHMPPSKRPKLSLKTSQLPTSYASSASTTSNGVAKLSTTTPTTLNTFSNTFDLSIRPSPSSATTSPASFHLRTKPAASPLRRNQPYSLNLPLGVRPILKNSRIANDYRRASLTASASPRNGRRVFFPPAKKVSFQPIDEEIITHTYTARHVDLSSSEDEQPNPGSEKGEPPQQDTVLTSTEATSEAGSPESSVTTPLQDRYQSPELDSKGRRRRQRSTSGLRLVKKKRRWEWTIGETESGDIPSEKMLTPISPPHTSNGEDTDTIEQGVLEDPQTPEASADVEQQDQAIDNIRKQDAGVVAESTEASEAVLVATKETELRTTASDSNEEHSLPSAVSPPSPPQPEKLSIVRALVKMFEGGS